MTTETHDISFIGGYQLQNLRKNQVKFFFFDLRDEKTRASVATNHPLLEGSVAVSINDLIDYVKTQELAPNAPIILVGTGDESITAARSLNEQGYINVYVVEGGASALDN